MRPPARPRRPAQLGTARPAGGARGTARRPAQPSARRPGTGTERPTRTAEKTSERTDRADDPQSLEEVDGSKDPDGAAGAERARALVARPGGPSLEGWSPARPATVSTRSAERFAERVRMRRALLRRRALLTAAGALGAGALAWLLLVSPVLALDVDRLTVAGDGGVVDPENVVAVVAEYHGVPLPRLDTVGLRRELLAVPGVRGAEVARDWPHGLRVVLVAREPVAAVPEGDGTSALLDRDGVRVGHADEVPEGLPLVDVPTDGDARALTAVLSVLEQLPADLAAEVAGVSARSRDTVTIELVDGQRVEWGSADQTALKAEVLMTLRDTGAADGAAVVDVSAPSLPITRS